MAVITPFRPLHYDPAVVGDIVQVVAPPYDVISDAYRDRLYQRSPYNVVRLILNPESDPYAAAARELAAWRRSGALVCDAAPAVCFYVENFRLPGGGMRERAGIMAAVRLEAFSSGRIRPHERTFARAKEDRMRLLRACRTNLSPIFGLYAGRPHALDPLRRIATQRRPDIDLRDDTDEQHRVWFITETPAIDAVAAALADAELVIADGHHRYETALTYRDELHAAGQRDPNAPHDAILMYLTSVSDPGLVILPTHRVLHQLPAGSPSDLPGRLRAWFRVQVFPRSAQAAFMNAVRAGHGRFGLVLRDHEDLMLASVEDEAGVAQRLAALAPAVRVLDVAMLDTVVLRGVVGIDCTAEAQAGRLSYTHDDASAFRAVEAGAAAAFLINPPSISEMLAVCEAGETMPEKSTYFFPKLLSGLVFRPLDPEPPSTQ
jgi:uncharacterized protein (DUF1015 family)